MRRKDREIIDKDKIIKILDECKVCRLAMLDSKGLYIVPLNFAYHYENNLILYFHSALNGRRINVFKENPNVAFEMDTHHQLKESDNACQYSYYYQSIIGNGKIEFANDSEKKEILKLFMKHQTQKDFVFDDKMCRNVCVFKLIVESMSVKSHEKD